jgi:hypothetical protein
MNEQPEDPSDQTGLMRRVLCEMMGWMIQWKARGPHQTFMPRIEPARLFLSHRRFDKRHRIGAIPFGRACEMGEFTALRINN